jgi:hypothetical protein
MQAIWACSAEFSKNGLVLHRDILVQAAFVTNSGPTAISRSVVMPGICRTIHRFSKIEKLSSAWIAACHCCLLSKRSLQMNFQNVSPTSIDLTLPGDLSPLRMSADAFFELSFWIAEELSDVIAERQHQMQRESRRHRKQPITARR